ncbi:hypothetical protein ACU8KH_03959 [Lachancea thermotolerans]
MSRGAPPTSRYSITGHQRDLSLAIPQLKCDIVMGNLSSTRQTCKVTGAPSADVWTELPSSYTYIKGCQKPTTGLLDAYYRTTERFLLGFHSVGLSLSLRIFDSQCY